VRVLLTNDDGVDAPGLAVLGRALHDAGLDVLVAAPLTEASGCVSGTMAGYTLTPIDSP
jgi:5'-nucleotidase